ncbi:hypothetical protein HYPBUDRAFT_244315 [Hyphopichia burtonii NRRL Y-1933]|uniref:Cyclin-like domain-containing protein n=1 Tax=Hyphopichia burtonii NRRL Y-1933 TaxID=984485 RepID=A0A1E4RC13_9ASCO|nr:hypothetical protein HYPBUDRAFT_244315 [Hyphopichia burtonii NRRL Y-1933]ODV64794.1 hypothetical protein HYPBUDRAFT_244315 [Hyphopichia burtonii NRRL Y-1933]
MMINSPDQFHQTRMNQSTIRSIKKELIQMERKSHEQSIDEYKEEMIEHLLGMEPSTQPNLSLIQQQPEINLRMRPLLLDFLMDVINKLNLSKSTFPLTVNLIDRYCSIRIVKKQHYQLLGLTSLWISCKNLDSKFKIPSLNDLCKMCCNCYDKKLFLEMENHVLKSLNWLITCPTFDSFIEFFINYEYNGVLAGLLNSQIDDINRISIYICELIQFYPNIYFNYNSSQIALTSFITSLKILNIKPNLSNLFSKFDKILNQEILNTNSFSQCFNLLIKILKCPPPSLKLKYFNDDGKYINLMKKLILFTNDNLNSKLVCSTKNYTSSGTTTPKFYPTTPTSNNIMVLTVNWPKQENPVS